MVKILHAKSGLGMLEHSAEGVNRHCGSLDLMECSSDFLDSQLSWDCHDSRPLQPVVTLVGEEVEASVDDIQLQGGLMEQETADGEVGIALYEFEHSNKPCDVSPDRQANAPLESLPFYQGELGARSRGTSRAMQLSRCWLSVSVVTESVLWERDGSCHPWAHI